MYKAEIHTAKGVMKLDFFEKDAPQHCCQLCKAVKKRFL